MARLSEIQESHIVRQDQPAGSRPGPDDGKSDQRRLEEALSAELPDLLIPGYWDLLAENCELWAQQINVSLLWNRAKVNLAGWADEFEVKFGGPLLSAAELPRFSAKPAESIISKCCREFSASSRQPLRNWNKVPAFPRLNDFVRTRVECNFLDGVEFLVKQLQAVGAEVGTQIETCKEGRLEGYFAHHVYFENDVFFRIGGSNLPVRIKSEIQVATRLSTLLWEISHPIYERWRGRPETRDEWQWNPKDPRFLARQLGHLFHLADGLLIQIRDAKGGKDAQ